jgi:hypothetical protein
MSTQILYAALGLAFLVFVVSRQVSRRTVTVKRLVGLPVAFAVLALVLDHGLAHRLASPVAIGFFAAGLVLAVPMGIARAATMRVWRTADGPVSRGDWRTVVLWLATVGARIGVFVLAARFGATESAGEAMIFVAATIAAQNAVLARRAGLWRPRTAELAPEPAR